MPNDAGKEFTKLINSLGYKYQTWQLFSDFVEMSALSIATAFNPNQDREDQYLRIISGYDQNELDIFPALLATTVDALEQKYCDFLGDMYTQLNLANHWQGQFFTPYHVSKMMAEMIFNKTEFENDRIVTVSEPTVGAGCMVIALCDVLRENGINYQRQLRIVAQDISYTAVCMSYIQLSLLGCDAQVIHGDSLIPEIRSRFTTPISYLNNTPQWLPPPIIEASQATPQTVLTAFNT